jgi:Tfp pilus assembly protein PilO
MQNNLFIIIRRYELIIGSVIILSSVAALSNFFVVPNFTKGSKILAEKQTLMSKLGILRQKDSRLVGIDASTYQSVYAKLNQILPEGKDYVSLFNTFDNLEKKTGVFITRTEFQLGSVSTSSSKLSRAEGGIPAYVVPLNISVEGEPDALQKFIGALNDFSGRLINIDSIKWAEGEGTVSQLAISGRAFFYPLPSVLGKIDSPLPKIESAQENILNKLAQITIAPPEGAGEMEKVPIGKKNLFQ